MHQRIFVSDGVAHTRARQMCNVHGEDQNQRWKAVCFRYFTLHWLEKT